MDIEKVTALTELLSASSLTAIEVGKGKNRVRVERQLTSAYAAPISVETQAEVPATPQALPEEKSADSSSSVDFNNLTEVRSPLVGVYYSALSPEAEPFVSIGSIVKKGDILCIIETMKLMNEVVSEYDGEIVDICIKNGDIAEFSQVLFKVNTQ